MDTNKLKELAELSAQWSSTIGCQDWYSPAMFKQPEFGEADSEYIAAANPQAILGLISEIAGIKAEAEFWNSAAVSHLEEVDRLKAENEALRKIISECATACGAGCHQECSLEFVAMLPDEIASVVGKRARNAAIGAVVWQFIDRMTDVCEQDPAERILEQFVAAVRPAIDAALEGGGR